MADTLEEQASDGQLQGGDARVHGVRTVRTLYARRVRAAGNQPVALEKPWRRVRQTGYSPGRRRRPKRGGPEGREMGRPASVSASKTPTAQAEDVSLAFGPEGTKVPAWRLLCEAWRDSAQGDAGLGLGSRGRPTGLTPDTHGLSSGGSGGKMCSLSTF